MSIRTAQFLPRDALQCKSRSGDRMSSVRLSVTLVDCDHIGWKTGKLIARTISPTPSLFVAYTTRRRSHKLYFAIFAAFEETVTLNLSQKSFKSSILVPIESAYITGQYSIATQTLSCTVSEIRRLKCRKSTFSPTSLLFRLKFGGVPFGVDPSCWGLLRAKRLG